MNGSCASTVHIAISTGSSLQSSSASSIVYNQLDLLVMQESSEKPLSEHAHVRFTSTWSLSSCMQASHNINIIISDFISTHPCIYNKSCSYIV